MELENICVGSDYERVLLLPYVALSSCANLGEKESVRERGKGRVGERERERRERREEREERGEREERVREERERQMKR